MNKPISFNLTDNAQCSATTEYGCCCECESRLTVKAHCMLIEHEGDGCNCSEDMGFYVCTIFNDMDGDGIAQICGEHGVCECFVKRGKK